MAGLVESIFQIISVSFFSFFFYNKKDNSKKFTVSTIAILLLWIAAWRFFNFPTTAVNMMIGEFFIMTSFFILFEIFNSYSKKTNTDNLKILSLFLIYPITLFFHQKISSVIISTLFFIIFQIVFKFLTAQKIKELRFRKRLEKIYVIFFYVVIIEDIISILLLFGLINNGLNSFLIMIWNITIIAIVSRMTYLIYKIKDVS